MQAAKLSIFLFPQHQNIRKLKVKREGVAYSLRTPIQCRKCWLEGRSTSVDSSLGTRGWLWQTFHHFHQGFSCWISRDGHSSINPRQNTLHYGGEKMWIMNEHWRKKILRIPPKNITSLMGQQILMLDR